MILHLNTCSGVLLDNSIEYPQDMFLCKNKKGHPKFIISIIRLSEAKCKCVVTAYMTTHLQFIFSLHSMNLLRRKF